MSQQRWLSPLKIILFTVFVDVLGLGILIPVIPILLADPASPHFLLPTGWTLRQGYELLGFLLAIFPFMQFLAAPILGQFYPTSMGANHYWPYASPAPVVDTPCLPLPYLSKVSHCSSSLAQSMG